MLLSGNGYSDINLKGHSTKEEKFSEFIIDETQIKIDEN